MRSPNWKLFTAFWAYTLFCFVFPYVLHRVAGLDLDDAFSGYPWNFSPFYAVSLFGGAFLASRVTASLLPVAAYLVLNLTIWGVTGRGDWAFSTDIGLNYVLYAMIPLFGIGLQKDSDSLLVKALGRGFAASLFYFVVSNFAVFLGGIYPRTFDGLVECYFMALPFYGPTLASTMLFTLVMFSPLGVPATAPVVENHYADRRRGE